MNTKERGLTLLGRYLKFNEAEVNELREKIKNLTYNRQHQLLNYHHRKRKSNLPESKTGWMEYPYHREWANTRRALSNNGISKAQHME